MLAGRRSSSTVICKRHPSGACGLKLYCLRLIIENKHWGNIYCFEIYVILCSEGNPFLLSHFVIFQVLSKVFIVLLFFKMHSIVCTWSQRVYIYFKVSRWIYKIIRSFTNLDNTLYFFCIVLYTPSPTQVPSRQQMYGLLTCASPVWVYVLDYNYSVCYVYQISWLTTVQR